MKVIADCWWGQEAEQKRLQVEEWETTDRGTLEGTEGTQMAAAAVAVLVVAAVAVAVAVADAVAVAAVVEAVVAVEQAAVGRRVEEEHSLT